MISIRKLFENVIGKVTLTLPNRQTVNNIKKVNSKLKQINKTVQPVQTNSVQ
ncbi:MAG: hypothetical protein WC188_02255 [Candidatus Caldatribacteriota bacterium]